MIAYYTTTLYPPIAMFVKRAVKITLIENYDEARKVEADLYNIAIHTSEPEVKPTASKKHLLLTRPKEEHSNELEKSGQNSAEIIKHNSRLRKGEGS